MADLFSYEVIAQAIGLLASAIVVSSFAHKRDNYLKGILIIGNIVFAIHFFMLGAFAGMLINLLNCFRVGFSIKFHKSTAMMIFFWGIYILAGTIIYEKPIDLLPVFSSVLGTYSMFKLSGIKLRVLGMLGSSAWLSYAIVFQSIGGIITETSVLLLTGSTIFRLTKDKKKHAHDQNTQI